MLHADEAVIREQSLGPDPADVVPAVGHEDVGHRPPGHVPAGGPPAEPRHGAGVGHVDEAVGDTAAAGQALDLILAGQQQLLVLIPDPDQPVVAARRGEQCSVSGEGEEHDGTCGSHSPDTLPGPAGVTLVSDIELDTIGVGVSPHLKNISCCQQSKHLSQN